MGYHMSQVSGRFYLPKRKFANAVMALQKLHGDEKQHVRWLKDALLKAPDGLPAVLLDLGWEPDVDERSGDIVRLMFNGEKAGEDFLIFQALAPFVRRDSFLHMEGEDGCHWRWWFTGKSALEQFGRVVFPSPRKRRRK